MMRIAAAYNFGSLRFPSQEICSRSAAGWGEMAAPAAIVTLRLLGECDDSSTGNLACANVTPKRCRQCLAGARLRSLRFDVRADSKRQIPSFKFHSSNSTLHIQKNDAGAASYSQLLARSVLWHRQECLCYLTGARCVTIRCCVADLTFPRRLYCALCSRAVCHPDTRTAGRSQSFIRAN